jgi:hypothetical protein
MSSRFWRSGQGGTRYPLSGGASQSYTGVGATRAFMLGDTTDAAHTQAILRTAHFARDNLTSFQLLFSDWQGGGESGSGAATTISAVIEYPIGVTRTRVTFGGLSNGTIPNGGSLLSDAIAVAIPQGAKFYIRQFKTNANGFVYNQYELANSALGDLVQVAASGLTDNLMTGDPTSNSTFVMAPAVIATISVPSVLIIGDSRAVGTSDTAGGNANGDAGEIARSIGPNFGYVKMALAGETASGAQGNSAQRASVAAYVTHIISNFGINDVRAGTSLANIQSYLQSLWANVGSDRYVIQTTVAPSELSGSPESTNPVRTALNDWLRANPALPTGGVAENADVVESARNSGLWKSGYTTDLIHENSTGYQAIQNAGIFPSITPLPPNPYPANPSSALFYPSTFSHSVWTKDGSTVTENAVTAPNSMRSADTLTPTTTLGEHRVYQGIPSKVYTKSVHAKAGGARYISIGGGTTGVPYAVFDLVGGTVVSSGAGASASITPSANGFYLCTVSGGAATTFMVINVGDTAADATPGTTWTATGTETVYLWQAQAV